MDAEQTRWRDIWIRCFGSNPPLSSVTFNGKYALFYYDFHFVGFVI